MVEIIVSIKSDIDSFAIVDFISEKCNQENLDFTIDINGIGEKKQIDAMRERFSKPIIVGDRIAIKVLTPRNKHFKLLDKYDLSDKIVVNIEPGISFGDGAHATTRLCIEMIEKYIQPNAKVLDVGCGSGILSIVSLLLGASHADGVDISGAAVDCARRNAELNNVSSRFTAINGNLTDSVTGQYDLIVANILTDPLKVLLGRLNNYTHNNTVVVLSGVVDFRNDEISEIMINDFDIIESLMLDNWVCYVMIPKV